MKPLEGKPEITYPCTWQYKVIGSDEQQVRAAIKDVCHPASVIISYSHCSSSGKYHSLNAEIEVEDEATRHALFKALQNHPHIKIVI